jgi:hypothetical protein
MSVGCYALSPQGGVRCDAYGPKEAPFVLVHVGGIMLRVRLCEAHERETNAGHRLGCTFNNYEKGDKCNCQPQSVQDGA